MGGEGCCSGGEGERRGHRRDQSHLVVEIEEGGLQQ